MLAEISARATRFLGPAHIVGKFTRKGIIRLQVSVKNKVLFGRMSSSPHALSPSTNPEKFFP